MALQHLAVLTGDLVASTRMPAALRDAAFEALATAALRIAAWQGADDPRFSRFRGDGWQMILADPPAALRACLYLRAALRAVDRGLDTRISIGIGGATLPESGLAAAGGPAFEASGRGLDRMARVERFTLAGAGEGGPADLARAVVSLADELSRRWTSRQAQVFAAALEPDSPVQATIAEGLGISQQAVAKHLQAGGDWAVRRGIAAFEAAL